MFDSICLRLTLLPSRKSVQPCIHRTPASGRAAEMRRRCGGDAEESGSHCQRPQLPGGWTGRLTPPALMQAWNSAAMERQDPAHRQLPYLCSWFPGTPRLLQHLVVVSAESSGPGRVARHPVVLRQEPLRVKVHRSLDGERNLERGEVQHPCSAVKATRRRRSAEP
jgi:hypothetical protein